MSVDWLFVRCHDVLCPPLSCVPVPSFHSCLLSPCLPSILVLCHPFPLHPLLSLSLTDTPTLSLSLTHTPTLHSQPHTPSPPSLSPTPPLPLWSPGALDFLVAPVAEALGADHVISNVLEQADGRFTGRLVGKPVADLEKAVRMREWSEVEGVDLGACEAYGDSFGDVGMLETAGKAVAVSPDSRLEAVARERGWEVVRWRG